MGWRNGGSKFKNSLNSNSKEVVLQEIKPGEFPFPLFFDSSVIPWSFRASPLYSVFLFSSPSILNALPAVARLGTGACWLPEHPTGPAASGHCRALLCPGVLCNCQLQISAALLENLKKKLIHLLWHVVETGQYNQKLLMRENRLWSSKPHFIKKVSLESCGNRQFFRILMPSLIML